MNTVEVLTKARDLIADPGRWTQGEYARTTNGNPIGVECANACKFCAVGAIARVMGTSAGDAEEDSSAFTYLTRAEPQPWSVNDHGGHDAVLAMYDRAIELAKGETEC